MNHRGMQTKEVYTVRFHLLKGKKTNPPKPNVNTQGSFSYLPLRQCLNSNVFKMLFGDL